ncbi:hypothetical protein MKK75_11485 [Methylobacterium sp. J-030]|uniref:hypothetical protein n=1 Tax=Methylobacterium sp. J-030 TaxID=2836627 RepID=UPI001FB89ECB|nr:hypothetical protein [Methylobacterium sp. J-030]MCJ2069406.1 hypothetical protein [Methylobacterium sp. J-030]
MNFEFRSIIKAGDLKDERITLRATSDLDVGDFILAQSGLVDDGPTAHFFYTFWFPYKEIKARDLVVLYTRSGRSGLSKDLENGNSAHFYYWELNEPIWHTTDRTAVLLNAPQWTSESTEKLIKF